MLLGLFEGAHYNSEARAKCAVYSRARTKQGRGVIKEIRYMAASSIRRRVFHLSLFSKNDQNVSVILKSFSAQITTSILPFIRHLNKYYSRDTFEFGLHY